MAKIFLGTKGYGGRFKANLAKNFGAYVAAGKGIAKFGRSIASAVRGTGGKGSGTGTSGGRG